MILVDSNILVTILRTRDAKLAGVLASHAAVICGVVRAELLQGARTKADRALVKTMISTLGSVPISETLWEHVGDNLAALRSKGVTIPLSDAVLATLAITFGIELWSRDQHFTLVHHVLPSLVLFQEPP